MHSFLYRIGLNVEYKLHFYSTLLDIIKVGGARGRASMGWFSDTLVVSAL